MNILWLFFKSLAKKIFMDKGNRASLFSALFVFFFDNFGVSVVFPIFAPIIFEPQYQLLSGNPLGTKNMLLGLLLAAYPFAMFIAAPILGDLADTIGRKKAFFWTIAGTFIGHTLSGVSLFFYSYPSLLFSRLLTGFFAGNLSICLASVADLSPDEKSRAKNFAWLATLGGSGWIIAIIIGGYLSNPELKPFFNPALPFWITASFSLISLLIVVFFFKETHPPSQKKIHFHLARAFHDVIQALKIRDLKLLYLMLLFWVVGWVISIQWFSGFSVQRFKVDQEKIVWAFVLQGIVWTLGSFVNRALIKRFSIKNIVIFALILFSISQFSTALVGSFWAFTGVYLLSSFFGVMCWSNSLNMVSTSASSEIQGKAMGLGQSMLACGQFLGPFLGGLLANVDIKLIYFSSATSVLIGLLFLLAWEIKN